MEPVEVTARFTQSGQVSPLSFTWNGTHYPVESTGRRWADDDGLHILVMVPQGRVFELLFKPVIGEWHLRTVGPGNNMV
jgi:hypothetical protein